MVDSSLQVGQTQPGTPGRPSEAEIRRMREYARALHDQQGSGYKLPFYTWANGLNDLTKALGEGWSDRQANQMERANTGTNADTFMGQGGPPAAAPFSQAADNEDIPPTSPAQRLVKMASFNPQIPQDQPTSQPTATETQPQTQPSTDSPGMGSSPPTSPQAASQMIPGGAPTPGAAGQSDQIRLAQALRDPTQVNDYRQRMGQMIRDGMNPEMAKRLMDSLYEKRKENLPVSDYDPQTGQVITRQLGRVPHISDRPIQNFAPPASNVEGIPGATQSNELVRQPDGTLRRQPSINIPRMNAPIVNGPRSEVPVAAPSRGVAQGAPTVPPTTENAPAPATAPAGPKSLLGQNAPSLEPWQVAFNDTVGQIPVPTKNGIKTAQAAAAEDTDPISQGLDPRNKEEGLALRYLDAAGKNRPKNTSVQTHTGDLLKEAAEAKDPYQAMNALSAIKGTAEGAKRVFEDTQIEQNKIYSKMQAGLSETTDQGIKLRPSIKSALKVMESKDWESGQFAKPYEAFVGGRQSLGQLAGRLASDEDMPQGIRDAAKKMEEWGRNPANAQAGANQVYTKLIAGSILQGMRGMLGSGAGRFMQSELALMQQVLGNNNLTPEANKIVLNIFDKVNDRNILIGKMADEYASRYGKLDARFNQYMTKFQQDHPPYDSKLYDEALKLTKPKEDTKTEPPKTKSIQPPPNVIQR